MITTRTAEFSDQVEGILYLRLLDGVEIELFDVIENYETTLKITQGRRYAVLTDARAAVSITREAREYAAKPELHKNLIAQAIVVTTLATRLTGNFIIQFHKPEQPTKLFSTLEEARKWLKKLVAEDDSSHSSIRQTGA